jgi:hypothetical protein
MKQSTTTWARLPRALPLLAALLVAACGGGGGDDDGSAGVPPPSGPQVPGAPQATGLALTQANARLATSLAIDNVANTSAAQMGTVVITGVQVQSAGAPRGTLAVAGVVRRFAAMAVAQGDAATGAQIDEISPCTAGGSLSSRGQVATSGQFTAGDNVVITANNCRETVDGATVTLNGVMRATIIGGLIGGNTFSVTMDITMEQFASQVGADTVVMHGDMRMLWNYSGATNQIYGVTGTSLATVYQGAGGTYYTRWQNYDQSISRTLNDLDTDLEADVTVQTPVIGSGAVQFHQMGGLRWDVGTGLPTAGIMTITGDRSRIMVGVSGTTPNAMALSLDADLDGTYEFSDEIPFTELPPVL